MTEPEPLQSLPMTFALPPPKMTWRWQLITFLRQLGVAVVTALVIVGVLAFGFHGQTAEEKQRQVDTLHANLAQACVLSLPVDEHGRDPDEVMRCFTQYGLQAPLLPTKGSNDG